MVRGHHSNSGFRKSKRFIVEYIDCISAERWTLSLTLTWTLPLQLKCLGEYGVLHCHCSQVHSDSKWRHVIVLTRSTVEYTDCISAEEWDSTNWGSRIHRLHLLRRVRLPYFPSWWKSVLSMGQIELNYVLIYRFISIMGRVFVNGPEDRCSISGRVIPMTQKW